MRRSQRTESRFTYETEIVKLNHDIAQRITEEINSISIGTVNYPAKYGVDGTFYALPIPSYPIIFYDLYGYLLIEDERYLKCHFDVAKKTIHITNGIHSLPGYKKYGFVPKALEKAHEAERIRISNLDKKLSDFRSIMQKAIDDAGTSKLQNENIKEE